MIELTPSQLSYIKRYYGYSPNVLIAKEVGLTARQYELVYKKYKLHKIKRKPTVKTQVVPKPFKGVKFNQYNSTEYHMDSYKYAEELEKCGYIVARDLDGNLPDIKPGGIYPVTIKPRKNWLQRLVSRLLTREA